MSNEYCRPKLADLGPVWHGSNSRWSCSTPELQVEPVLVGVGALSGASSRWSRSCKRGAPKLHLHLHYSSIELAAPWSFGVGVFGWKIGWSCWSSTPEPRQTPPKSTPRGPINPINGIGANSRRRSKLWVEFRRR